MGTIATEHPRATTRRPLATGKNFNLRALFAGGAATLALIGAGIVVFGSLAAYVAFNGLPVGGGDNASGSVAVEASSAPAASAPARAAAALAAAPGAVAAVPAAATAIAPAPGSAAAADATAGTAPAGTVTPGETTTTTPTGTTAPGTTPTSTTPTAPAGSTDSGSSSGPVGSAVQGLQDTVSGAGVDLPLSETTQGLTDQVDQTVTGTLDGVGGVIGDPNLGQQVGGTLNDVTGNLLGN